MVGEAGIEPTTPGLEGRCSIQLSYSPRIFYCSFEARQRDGTAGRTESAEAEIAAVSAVAAPPGSRRRRVR